MRIEMIEKLCCPFDKADLELNIIKRNGDHIEEGFLTCSVCGRIYPIVKGVPIMSPDEYREAKLELPLFQKWEKHLNGKQVENFRLTAPEG